MEISKNQKSYNIKKIVPFVSIIVSVKNEEKRIQDTLNSLIKLDFPNYEIILVDGGSTDNTLQIANKYPIKIIKTNDKTPGQGRNSGLINTSSEIVAFTDGDCIPYKDWLKNAVSLLISNKKIGGVGGPVFPYERAPFLSRAILNSLSSYYVNLGSTNFYRYKNQLSVDNIPSQNAIYKKTVFGKAGLFDEDLRFCEDVELNNRILNNGYKLVFSPNVKIKHNWKVESIQSLFGYMFRYGKGRGIASQKKQLSGFKYLIPSIFLLSIFIIIIFSIFQKNILIILYYLSLMYIIIAELIALKHVYLFKDIRYILITPLTFLITHFSYAIGNILGLIFKNNKIIFIGES
jgi:glycosyltransferase involved in cell wall biosynthesis